MTEQERQALKVKVASCPDCKGWITQSAFPHCESSKDSIKNFREHAKAGDTIDVMTVGEAMLLNYCRCGPCAKPKRPLPKPPEKG